MGCWSIFPDSQSSRSRPPMAAQPPSGSYSQVSIGYGHGCGIMTDGSAVCWGNDEQGVTRVPGGRSFVSMTAFRLSSCGLRTDGEVDCWGHRDYVGEGWPDGPFSSIAGDPTFGCGLKENGRLLCWNSVAAFPYNGLFSPEGSFSSVSMGQVYGGLRQLNVCGLKVDGQAVCWGNNDFGQELSLDGPFVSVDTNNLTTCGVKMDGSLTCWGRSGIADKPEICRVRLSGPLECDDLELGDLASPEGSYESMTVSGGGFCGTRTDGYLVCRTPSSYSVVSPLAGPLTGLTWGGPFCGIGGDQSIRCWGNLVAVPPSGKFVSVESYSGVICGLKDDGSLVCALPEGEYGEKWLPPEGRFQAFGMGGGPTGEGLACGVRLDGTLQCWGPLAEFTQQRYGHLWKVGFPTL